MSEPARRGTSLGVVFLVLFIDLIGFSIVFPLYRDMLVHYEAQDTGLIHLVLTWVDGLAPHASLDQRAALFGGILGAAYSGLQFFCAPIWGKLSDRYGRRPILLLSITGTTVAYALWIVSADFSTLLISRLIAGIMTGNVSVANAAVADITTPQTRAKGMGLIGMAFGLGFILGPAIGGFSWSVGNTYLPSLADPANRLLNPFSVPAAVAFVLSLLNLVWAFTHFTETLPVDRRTAQGEPTRTINPLQLFDATLGAGVRWINAAFLLHTMLFAGLEATLVFLTAERCHFTPTGNGLLFMWMGFLSAMVQGFIFRRLSGRVGQKPLTMAGLVLMLPGFTCIGAVDWFPHTWLLILGVSILAGGTGLIFPGLNTMASLAGDPRRQGWVMGTFRSAGSMGRAAGPLIGAVLYFSLRPSAPYLVGAIGMLLPLLIVTRLRFVPATEAPAHGLPGEPGPTRS